MNEQMSLDEVAILIRGRKILKARGLPKDADVKTICEAAGISRKTGYQWASKLEQTNDDQEHELQADYDHLKAEHGEFQKRYEDLRFENEGRKLAWRIHGVDELLASKKNTMRSRKKQKR